jgi:hypothetical protein
MPVPRPPLSLSINVFCRSDGSGLTLSASMCGSESTGVMLLSGIMVEAPETRTP